MRTAFYLGGLALVLGIVGLAPADVTKGVPKTKPVETLTVAILDFDTSTPGEPHLGEQVSEALTATLTGEAGFTLVDRSSLAHTLAENQLNLTGLVNADQATQIGRLAGAKILITGKIFPVDDQIFFTAKLIGTETSFVEGVLVQGEKNAKLGDRIMQLSDKVATRLRQSGPRLVAQEDALQDPLPGLKKSLAGINLPKLGLIFQERHIGASPAVVLDPAAATELVMVLKEVGFTIFQGNEKELADADVKYLIDGEAFSEFAARIADLVNCTARAEIKVINRKTGEIIFSDRETTRAIDLAENSAGKTALQKAGHLLGVKLVQHFTASLLTATDGLHTDHANKPKE